MKQIKTICGCLILAGIGLLSCKNTPERKDSPAKDSIATQPANPYVAHDQSPLDLVYFPKNYPVLRMNGADSNLLVARVIYSRPQKKGRKIFGDGDKSLVHLGKEWRLGANEATEIEFFKNVRINNAAIARGNYIIYAIPFADKWTIIFNRNLYTWGLHMDPAKDVFKVDVPVQLQSPALEDFTIILESMPDGVKMIMAWDDVKTELPITFAK